MASIKFNLLTFLRKGEVEEIKKQLSELNEEEWNVLLGTARRQKLGPILFHCLKPYYSSTYIPICYQDQIRNEYFNSATRNMRLYSQLEDILKKFANEDIPVILLKGAHLAKYIYENIAFRPMVDIDLMIKQDDLEKAHRLLIEDGYRTSEKLEEELPPYEKKGKIPVEIHSHLKILPNEGNVDIASLWARAEKVYLGEVQVLTLCPEDLILHLCLHSCNHHCLEHGLISCLDISHTVIHYEEKLDWNQLWARGQKWGIERSVYLMLALTEKTIGPPIPEEIKLEMKPDYKALNALAEAEDLIFEQFTDLSPNVSSLFRQQGWRRRFDILLERIFLAEESDKFENTEMNKSNFLKAFIIFPYRLWILFKRYRKTIWLALCGDQHTVNTIKSGNRRQDLRRWFSNSEEV